MRNSQALQKKNHRLNKYKSQSFMRIESTFTS